MGAWGPGAFDNDAASDWSKDLVDAEDLSLIQHTLSSAQEVDDDELDSQLTAEALAACEVLARLLGRAGLKNSRSDVIDQWVRAHPVRPEPGLLRLATSVIDRISAGGTSVPADLRKRVAGN
jgi:hypothetical protein